MSLECSECERDLRGEHAEACSRHPDNCMNFLWHEGPVRVAIRARICEPFGVHESLDDDEVFILTHTPTGYSLGQVLTAAKIDTSNRHDVQSAAETLMRSVPHINDLLHLAYNTTDTHKRHKIRDKLIAALTSENGDRHE